VKEYTLWHEYAYGFVAYEGDKPVSTATAVINDGYLYLFLVATSPDSRRKGYGEAVCVMLYRQPTKQPGFDGPC
jgi:ribosomal protein S18 acetylase RimI-like enzyme